MTKIWAKQALTTEGWQSGVALTIDNSGKIVSIEANSPPSGHQVGIALPAPANLHSHGFQRALAGLTEVRSQDNPTDSFWTWRKLMYEFINLLQPEDIEAITAFAQMEMLESGFASVAEFHYVHHNAGGSPYDDVAELSKRIIAAADQSGIGLTLLPVFYQFGGCGKKELQSQQYRFANDLDSYTKLFDEVSRAITKLPADSNMGMAAHSLRAVDPFDLVELSRHKPTLPFHVHVAEQVKEVEEFQGYFGARPVEWLIQNADLDETWCLVHATHMTQTETRDLASSGAVAGLCPITEANLGDGIFFGAEFSGAGGKFGIGTDSNVNISLCEELRTLEYSQRLQHQERSVLAQPGISSGRALFDSVSVGGDLALKRGGGALQPGRVADILVLDEESIELTGLSGDTVLDSFVFSGDNRMVSEVWSAGRHVVKDGKHINRHEIQTNFKQVRSHLLRKL